ncbi:MAG: hypothetical protein PHQ40_21515, partial [Anaerolineaceae bacterium]|nr:hypothetical protein [Anaerolineaceae bacterium]
MRYKKCTFLMLPGLLLALLVITASSGWENIQPNHCYSLLSPIQKDGFSQTLETACFDTFAQALRAATQGRVELAPSIR